MSLFKIRSGFTPKGDQPAAIQAILKSLGKKKKHQVLLGVTGSGKTFTMAHVIAGANRPALIMAPNKTLAAQLYNEFRGLFPENAVEYFVSYYDYYQPEAYIPSSDTYIQKDSSLNELIDKMRHSATRSVLSRRDVIVVASVSCIFGLGAPEDYMGMRINLENDQELVRDHFLSDLVRMQYNRNDFDFYRGGFRVRGDCVDIFPAYEENTAIRIAFFGDQIDMIAEIDPLRGTIKKRVNCVTLFPASHYVTKQQTRQRAIKTIIAELKERHNFFRDNNQLVEAQRIEERTNFDLEMMQEIGYCTGIENYSRHLTARAPGEPPPTLMDYFPDDYLLFIDESHISVPQVRAMYKGDRSRKQTLVQYGFRLPSALDNRPLKFDEFEYRTNQVIYISATPSDYEIDQGGNSIVEQIVRPTGLLDPAIDIRPAKDQVDDLLEQIRERINKNERVLVTTLTKRMAEDLTEYYKDLGLKVRYLHSDINTFERMDIIQDFRTGIFDVLIGINLLREGLDLPEITLVAILDADKEGFLRSVRSLIQTSGRASRNVNGKVIMYADKITASMKTAVEETRRRRKIQQTYNKIHHITPETIKKEIVPVFMTDYNQTGENAEMIAESLSDFSSTDDIGAKIKQFEKKMDLAARDLEFEKAARFRDRIQALKNLMMFEL